MSRIMVTGVNGFVGKHLVRLLAGQNHEVIGVGYDGAAHAEIRPLLMDYIACDLTNETAVDALPLDGLGAVINLAGLAKVGESFADPEKYKLINVRVLSVLGERLLQKQPTVRLIAVSTGAVYDPDQPMPLTEDSAVTKEGSPYAKSKLLMEEAGGGLRQKGLDCVVVRPFNHSGPGQESGFIIPDLYDKLFAFKESGKPVAVNPRQTKRDYTDVRDIVKAYGKLATTQHLSFDTYNICSGVSRSGKEILDLLSSTIGINKVETVVDPSLLRPDDPEDIYGSYQKLHDQTGWAPNTTLEQTIADFVAWKEQSN